MRDTFTPPPGLDALLAEAGLGSDAPPAAHRAAVEALAARDPARLSALDPALLHLRALETAGEGLPDVIGDVRRARLLDADPISTTWEGWNQRTGDREAVRCLRPHFRRDPVWHRRLERGVQAVATVPGLAPLRWRAHDDWPHVHLSLPGTPLADLLPVEDPPDTPSLVRWAAHGLARLEALHRRGRVHGNLGPRHLLLRPDGLVLAWFDPIREHPGDPVEDIAALARCFLAMDPTQGHPLLQLVAPWASAPPASAEDALRILRRHLADHLLEGRHRLVLRARRHDRQSRGARLLHAVTGLAQALPPPEGRACLRAGHDGTLALVESDGRRILGGFAAGVPPRGLTPLYTPERGLDAPLTRSLLRAWARREDGDPDRQARVQADWGGSDRVAGVLARWLTASSRLRTARMLLEHRVR